MLLTLVAESLRMRSNLRFTLIANKTRNFLPVFAISPHSLHELDVIDWLPCLLFALLSLLRSFDVSSSFLVRLGLSFGGVRKLDKLLLFKQTVSLCFGQRCDEQLCEGVLKILDWLVEQCERLLF